MIWNERARLVAEQKGFSHERLGEMLGKGRSTVSGWFNGIREPKLDEIFAIADALGVTRQWLLFGDGEGKDSEIVTVNALPIPIINRSGNGKVVSIYVPTEVQGRAAYEIEKNTGIAEAPIGSVVVVNPTITPQHNDLVYVEKAGESTVFRVINVGTQLFFGVDDPRVPLLANSEGLKVLGVIVFISINLKN